MLILAISTATFNGPRKIDGFIFPFENMKATTRASSDARSLLAWQHALAVLTLSISWILFPKQPRHGAPASPRPFPLPFKSR